MRSGERWRWVYTTCTDLVLDLPAKRDGGAGCIVTHNCHLSRVGRVAFFAWCSSVPASFVVGVGW